LLSVKTTERGVGFPPLRPKVYYGLGGNSCVVNSNGRLHT
jgi:hypothetical protein